MPNFWSIQPSRRDWTDHGIYQARFNEYLKDRGLKDTSGKKSGLSSEMVNAMNGIPWCDYLAREKTR